MSPWGRHWAPLWPIFSWLIWETNYFKKNQIRIQNCTSDTSMIFSQFSKTNNLAQRSWIYSILNTKAFVSLWKKVMAQFLFLDVEIKINPNGFDTWTWRKPTHTGLFLNFCAVCPKARKEGLVLCLLHRAKAVCSSVKFLRLR